MSRARRPASLPPRARKLPASPYYAASLPTVRPGRRWTLYAPDGTRLGHAKAVGAFGVHAYPADGGGELVRTGSLRDAAAHLDRQRTP